MVQITGPKAYNRSTIAKIRDWLKVVFSGDYTL
jgi:hypothetical protein